MHNGETDTITDLNTFTEGVRILNPDDHKILSVHIDKTTVDAIVTINTDRGTHTLKISGFEIENLDIGKNIALSGIDNDTVITYDTSRMPTSPVDAAKTLYKELNDLHTDFEAGKLAATAFMRKADDVLYRMDKLDNPTLTDTLKVDLATLLEAIDGKAFFNKMDKTIIELAKDWGLDSFTHVPTSTTTGSTTTGSTGNTANPPVNPGGTTGSTSPTAPSNGQSIADLVKLAEEAIKDVVDNGKSYRSEDALKALKEITPKLAWRELELNKELELKVLDTLDQLSGLGGAISLTKATNDIAALKEAVELSGKDSLYDRLKSQYDDYVKAAADPDLSTDGIEKNIEATIRDMLKLKSSDSGLEWNEKSAEYLVNLVNKLVDAGANISTDLIDALKVSIEGAGATSSGSSSFERQIEEMKALLESLNLPEDYIKDFLAKVRDSFSTESTAQEMLQVVLDENPLAVIGDEDEIDLDILPTTQEYSPQLLNATLAAGDATETISNEADMIEIFSDSIEEIEFLPEETGDVL